MDSNEKQQIDHAIQATLKAEAVFLQMIDEALKQCKIDEHTRKRHLLPLIRIVRCYGQIDAILSMIETDGDTDGLLANTLAEIQSTADEIGRKE